MLNTIPGQTAKNLRGKSFLKLLDLTSDEIRYLIDLSKNFKDMKRAGVPHRYLEGKNIVLLFEKTSTRTRCAFEVAGHDLAWALPISIRVPHRWGTKSPLKTQHAFWDECLTASNTAVTARSW